MNDGESLRTSNVRTLSVDCFVAGGTAGLRRLVIDSQEIDLSGSKGGLISFMLTPDALWKASEDPILALAR